MGPVCRRRQPHAGRRTCGQDGTGGGTPRTPARLAATLALALALALSLPSTAHAGTIVAPPGSGCPDLTTSPGFAASCGPTYPLQAGSCILLAECPDCTGTNLTALLNIPSDCGGGTFVFFDPTDCTNAGLATCSFAPPGPPPGPPPS